MMKKNSERNAAIRFMKKLFILFIPFIALLAVYFLDDPFMVLKNYERYDQTPVVLNEGHVGWQMYLNNRDTIPIDSYIMGKRRSLTRCFWPETFSAATRAQVN
jgi:hypothetical protein